MESYSDCYCVATRMTVYRTDRVCLIQQDDFTVLTSRLSVLVFPNQHAQEKVQLVPAESINTIC